MLKTKAQSFNPQALKRKDNKHETPGYLHWLYFPVALWPGTWGRPCPRVGWEGGVGAEEPSSWQDLISEPGLSTL